MLAKRIIPCLDVKEGRVVKGVNFVNLRDAGDPVEQARIYDAQGADELVFLDISATIEGRKTMIDMVRQVAVEVNPWPLLALLFILGKGRSPIDHVKTLQVVKCSK